MSFLGPVRVGQEPQMRVCNTTNPSTELVRGVLVGHFGEKANLFGRRSEPENNTETTVVKAGAGNPELTNLGGVLHVRAQTRTHIVITHINQTQSLAGILGQTAQVNAIWYLIARNVFGYYGQILADDLVHAGLNLAHLLIGQRLRQIIIALALFALNMVHSGTPAMEHIVHSAVQDVLCSMRRRVFILVMRIQNRLFHIANV